MLTLNSSCLLPPALSTWLSSFQVHLSPCFFFFFPPHLVASGILVLPPGMELTPFAVKAWSLNHWTTREFPLLPASSYFLKNIYSVPSILQKLSYYFLNMYLFTWLLWVLVTAHGSSSLIRVWTRPPVLGVLSPNHWTTREVLSLPVSE